MRFLRKIAVIFISVLEVITSSGFAQAAEASPPAAEEGVRLHDDNNDGKPYLYVGIEIDGHKCGSGLEGKWYSVTDYSSYPLYVAYSDGNQEKTLDWSECEWKGIKCGNSPEDFPAEATIYCGRLWTGAVLGMSYSFSAVYTTPEGERLESLPCRVKVSNLILGSGRGAQKEILQYAALCLAVGTNFKSDAKGKSIGYMLENMYPLNQKSDYICKKKGIGATFGSFYSAAISNWKLIEYKSGEKGFYAALFQDPSQNYVLAFRGTEDIGDYLADLKLGTGHSSIQLDQGFDYYKQLQEKYKGKITILTGHSLGGGIANYVSDLQNVKAITFNAPSTMVSAINEEHTDFAKNFTGLGQTRRTDYVNVDDWVGNTGIGDNKESTRFLTGQSVELINGVALIKLTKMKAKRQGGLIDRTNFEGKDEISDYSLANVQYYYFSGNGLGTIKDFGGKDTIEIYNCGKIEVKDSADKGYKIITADGKDIIKISMRGTGKYVIVSGGQGGTAGGGVCGKRCRDGL